MKDHGLSDRSNIEPAGGANAGLVGPFIENPHVVAGPQPGAAHLNRSVQMDYLSESRESQ